MKLLLTLSLAVTLSVTARSQAMSLKLEGPRAVVAGETIAVKAVVPSGVEGAVTIQFNGLERLVPSDLEIIEAEDCSGSSRVVEGGDFSGNRAVVSQEDYETLFSHRKMIKGDQRVYIWFRSRNTSMCLKDSTGKELRWSWGSPRDLVWRSFGSFAPADIRDGFSIMGPKASPESPAVLDSVIITRDGRFTPAGNGDPMVFTWRTNFSSVGNHAFSATLIQNEKVVASTQYRVSVRPNDHRTRQAAGRRNTGYHQAGEDGFAAIDIPQPNFGSNIENQKLRLFAHGWIRENKHKLMPYPFSFQGTGDESIFAGLYGELTEESRKFPKSFMIPVGRFANALVFLHAELGSRDLGEVVMTYRVTFSDQGTVDIPVREGMEISGWLKPNEVTNAEFLLDTFNGAITNKFYVMKWPVPDDFKGQLIYSVEVISAQTKAVGVVLGLGTLESASALVSSEGETPEDVFVTVNFGNRLGKISPYLFGTNDTEWEKRGDNSLYHRQMAAMNPGMVRLHFHSRMRNRFPEPDANLPLKFDGDLYDLTFTRPDRQGQEVMVNFGQFPRWADMNNAEHREIYAQQCLRVAQWLVRERGYAIRWWQPMNEPYASGVDKERGVWKFYNLLAEKIKKLQPGAKVGGPVICWPDEGIIEDFLKHCGKNVDFVAWHWYPTGSTQTPTHALMQRTSEAGAKSAAIRKLVRRYISDRHVPLALTEFNMNYEWRPKKDDRQQSNVGAVWFASVLKHLIDAEHDIALTWHSRDNGFGLFRSDDTVTPPAALVQVLNRYFAGANRVQSQSSSEHVETVVVSGPSHEALMLINKSPDEQTARMTLLNLPYRPANGLDRSVREFRISEKDQPVTETRTNATPAGFGQQIVNLEPYSIRVFVYTGQE